MSLPRCRAMLGLAVFLSMATVAWAQPGPPHIGYVFPAGARQGAECKVTLGGQYLEGVTKAFISGKGVELKVLEYNKPMTPQQANQLRQKVQELQKKDTKDAAMRKEMADIRAKLATFVRKPSNASIIELVTLQVTVAADAEPGQRELRLETPLGLTDPLAFFVGQLPEYSKKPRKLSDEAGGSPQARFGGEANAMPPEPPVDITLPTVINGQIMQGEVDHYRFKAKKGERVVVAVSARELIPYLPDAVPGWFQAALAVYDAKGNELAFADHFLFHPDPVVYYKIPADGQYTIEVRDSIYRGREDFVYRITAGDLPFVTSIFPLGGKAGEQTAVKVAGWNLASDKLTVDASEKSPGVISLTVANQKQSSNSVPFALDALPECLEKEPNNTPAEAQRVTLPIIINGRVDAPGDWDVFRFEGRAGQKIVAEVFARRLDSPLDSVLKLTDSGGKQLAFNDDYEDKGSGLNTHHADSYLTATLPADGPYYVHLGDVQHQGGPAYGYRLRISEPRPDFALRVVPSSVNARPGASVPITVYALRRDGFPGEITIALKDPPAGFKLSGARVPANQDQVRLTLTAPYAAPEEPVNLSFEGRAKIEGHEVVRAAVPAEDMMQAFAYRHLVPAKNMMVAIIGRGRGVPAARLLGQEPVKIAVGGTTPLRFSVGRAPIVDQLQFALSEPPEGIAIEKPSAAQDGVTLLLHADAEKVKPGLKGNLIVDVFIDRVIDSEKAKAKGATRRISLGTLPAIPFEVVGQP